MEIKRGIPVSPGISIAEVLVLDSEEIRIPQRFIPKSEVEAEVERFEEAVSDSNRLLERKSSSWRERSRSMHGFCLCTGIWLRTPLCTLRFIRQYENSASLLSMLSVGS